jgi:hypothetical protein
MCSAAWLLYSQVMVMIEALAPPMMSLYSHTSPGSFVALLHPGQLKGSFATATSVAALLFLLVTMFVGFLHMIGVADPTAMYLARKDCRHDDLSRLLE